MAKNTERRAKTKTFGTKRWEVHKILIEAINNLLRTRNCYCASAFEESRMRVPEKC